MTIEHTHVIGYFNANTFPVNLHISRAGIYVTLLHKQFVRAPDGTLINDPILEDYCQPYMLSKQLSDREVPVTRFAPVSTSPTGFASTTEMEKDANGFNVEPERPTTQAFTMEEARRLNLLPGQHDPLRKPGQASPKSNQPPPLPPPVITPPVTASAPGVRAYPVDPYTDAVQADSPFAPDVPAKRPSLPKVVKSVSDSVAKQLTS